MCLVVQVRVLFRSRCLVAINKTSLVEVIFAQSARHNPWRLLKTSSTMTLLLDALPFLWEL